MCIESSSLEFARFLWFDAPQWLPRFADKNICPVEGGPPPFNVGQRRAGEPFNKSLIRAISVLVDPRTLGAPYPIYCETGDEKTPLEFPEGCQGANAAASIRHGASGSGHSAGTFCGFDTMDAVITPMAVETNGRRCLKRRRRCIDTAWPLAKRAWRKAISFVCCFPDTGLFGLTPLRKHIVICGYPRTGSTMLQLMLEHAYPQARCFMREVPGHRAAMLRLRNHALLVSKQPGDIFRLHQLQNHYAKKRPNRGRS